MRSPWLLFLAVGVSQAAVAWAGTHLGFQYANTYRSSENSDWGFSQSEPLRNKAIATAVELLNRQLPSGGWEKRDDVAGNTPKPASPLGGTPAKWQPVGTFDNEHTTAHLMMIGRAIDALPPSADPSLRSSLTKGFRRGLEFIKQAQHEQGWFPQEFSPDPSVHVRHNYAALPTLNDDSMTNVMEFLFKVQEGKFHFLNKPDLLAAREQTRRGVEFLLRACLPKEGPRCAWAQQYEVPKSANDPLTPAGARTFEPPAFASSETVAVMRLLERARQMESDPAMRQLIVQTLTRARAWLDYVKISTSNGLKWSRFYETTPPNRPFVADRKGNRYFADAETPIYSERAFFEITEKLRVADPERLKGYSWLNACGQSELPAAAPAADAAAGGDEKAESAE